PGELLALLGPSGSGKSTLLRVIAGLEVADAGRIHYEDEDVTARTARDRNVGFVFQHYALFRHMNVFENIAFGLRVRRRPRDEINRRVHELLGLVRLDSMERRYPAQLSGGQCQRVALARALAIEPKVLLLDEPFGALDAKVRHELRHWLRRLHDEIHMTTVFVTHDQEEAFEVADRVVVMQQGKVEQAGTPQEVFERPANSFVMDFLGNVNVFHGRVHGGLLRWGGLHFDLSGEGHDEGSPVAVYVRPHELDIERSANGAPSLRGQIERINAAGPVAKVQVSAAEFGVALHVELSQERYTELDLKRGETVFVSPRRARAFAPDYVI
ncbi:MAG TPA: sulfate/molybdate ABC transporter ATP-binding protein, partial [Pirellulales bacterium]|nr:sulfate/molybdate ABC transporter ATP-binding protein [Pirellulales bacterium]